MFVSRQYQYYSGAQVVEVAATLDSSGCDALCARYPGEMQSYDSAVEAVNAAIEVAKAWQADDGKRHPISIIGKLAGEMGFESETTTRKDAIQWAKKRDASRPKCCHCGSVLPENKRSWWYAADDFGEEEFACCSEQCAEREYEKSMEMVEAE